MALTGAGGLEAAAAATTGQTINICIFNTARKVKKTRSKRISLASKRVSRDQTKAAKVQEDSKAVIQRSQSSHFRDSQDSGSGDLEPDISDERANTTLFLPQVLVETQATKRTVLGFSLYSLL